MNRHSIKTAVEKSDKGTEAANKLTIITAGLICPVFIIASGATWFVSSFEQEFREVKKLYCCYQ